MDPYNGFWHIPHTTRFWIFDHCSIDFLDILPSTPIHWNMSLFKVGMYKDLLARGLMGYHNISPFGPGPYLQNGLQINVFFSYGGWSFNHLPIFSGDPYPSNVCTSSWGSRTLRSCGAMINGVAGHAEAVTIHTDDHGGCKARHTWRGCPG